MTHAQATGGEGLAHCPIMPTYGPPPVMFVRGSGTELFDRDGTPLEEWTFGTGF